MFDQINDVFTIVDRGHQKHMQPPPPSNKKQHIGEEGRVYKPFWSTGIIEFY